jgi:DNA-binding NtrC family response regulator
MMSSQGLGRVLIVEDDEETRFALMDAVRDFGHEVVAESGGEAALKAARSGDFGVVLTDIRMEGVDGLELCARLSEDGRGYPIVVMTAFGDTASATGALRAGAFDFLTKPFTLHQLSAVLDRALRHGARLNRMQPLPTRPLPQTALQGFVGESEAMRSVHEAITLAAPTEATVLITGESGTGKELVARAIHRGSPRADGPFVGISCAALPSSVLEAEFFGCVRGAFTGATENRRGLLAQADGGTLFLDEIGDMPLDLQPKLLRALQQRLVRPLGTHDEISVDVRIIAATNVDLESRVVAGEFREDLYYRLNILGIRLPPLRDRLDDVPLLAKHFLSTIAGTERPHELSKAAEAALCRHHWPGNVRELENCMMATVALAKDTVIRAEDLALPREHAGNGRSAAGDEASLEAVERRHIALALAKLDWNKAMVAHRLGIDRATLYRKMKRYGIGKASR